MTNWPHMEWADSVEDWFFTQLFLSWWAFVNILVLSFSRKPHALHLIYRTPDSTHEGLDHCLLSLITQSRENMLTPESHCSDGIWRIYSDTVNLTPVSALIIVFMWNYTLFWGNHSVSHGFGREMRRSFSLWNRALWNWRIYLRHIPSFCLMKVSLVHPPVSPLRKQGIQHL